MTQRNVPWQIVQETASDILRLKGRAVLALVGVAIGTAAVIAMLHIGYNSKVEALRQFEALGTDVVMITPQSADAAASPISLDMVDDLGRDGVGVTQTAALIQGGGAIVAGHSKIPTVILATTENIYSLTKTTVTTGRLTSDLDGFEPYAVIGADIAATFKSETGKALSINDKLKIEKQIFTVIGILRSTDQNPILGLDLNNSIAIPFAAARHVIPSPSITNVAARLSPGADDVKASNEIIRYFQTRLSAGSVTVNTARQVIRAIEQQMGIYALLLLAIGTVSLVVGGVGIMNVMLMGIMERRHEIGLRQAIGARRVDIRLMFLAEALVLSIVGSAAGVVVGFGVGWVFSFTAGWHFEPAPAALPLALGMALVVGLFFGIYPASRAAKLDPIEALRSL